YALLGSSGSGKTTALSCILGLRDLDEGEIKVFGVDPSEVSGQKIGFMPQDLCLYEYLTAVETLKYFGQIYGMDSNTIEESIHFLIKLLNLGDVTNVVSTLSGGQKRRYDDISFGHPIPVLETNK
ncbi:ABC transporter G family member 23, partial [Orchesella cincta]